jgi:hypothetical protein
MALDRDDITVVDDDGTETTGTVFDAAFFEALYDAIDTAIIGPNVPFFNVSGLTDERFFTFPDVNAVVFTDQGIANTALKIRDTDASHFLSIVPGSDLSADRVFTLVTGDAARTMTLSGNPTLSDWFDQSVKAASSPVFAAVKTAAGGLQTLDTNASHYLKLTAGSDLTADRTYTIVTGDSDRTVTLSGNPTLADWFDQAVKTASSPTFSGVTVTTLTVGAVTLNSTEAGFIDGVTAGAAAASKAVVLDTNKDVASLRNLSAAIVRLNTSTIYSDGTVNTMSMGWNSSAYGWIQVKNNTDGSTLVLNPQGGSLGVGLQAGDVFSTSFQLADTLSFRWSDIQLSRAAANRLKLATGDVFNLAPTAFASLPTGAEGDVACVTDSSTSTPGATITGGGANNVLAFFNGANWVVIV